MVKLTKHQFKICEAVHLKMDYYYMGPKDRRKLTDKEREEAARLLPQLPNGWMNEEQEWFLHKIPKKKLKDEIIED